MGVLMFMLLSGDGSSFHVTNALFHFSKLQIAVGYRACTLPDTPFHLHCQITSVAIHSRFRSPLVVPRSPLVAFSTPFDAPPPVDLSSLHVLLCSAPLPRQCPRQLQGCLSSPLRRSECGTSARLSSDFPLTKHCSPVMERRDLESEVTCERRRCRVPFLPPWFVRSPESSQTPPSFFSVVRSLFLVFSRRIFYSQIFLLSRRRRSVDISSISAVTRDLPVVLVGVLYLRSRQKGELNRSVR